MRVFSRTCSNTEVVEKLPRPGRDLELDVEAVLALSPIWC